MSVKISWELCARCFILDSRNWGIYFFLSGKQMLKFQICKQFPFCVFQNIRFIMLVKIYKRFLFTFLTYFWEFSVIFIIKEKIKQTNVLYIKINYFLIKNYQHCFLMFQKNHQGLETESKMILYNSERFILIIFTESDPQISHTTWPPED